MSTNDRTAEYTFTVFTGTRNRAHTLPRVYESLKAQTYHDFEWLIVDNESSDGTPELVAGWQTEAIFPIRYFYHANRGQQGSLNRAVAEAHGALFLDLDSDDSCLPEALERLKFHWDSIPVDTRDHFSGVTVQAMDERGAVQGARFPFDPTDSSSLEIRFRHKIKGEYWGFQRTDVMRHYPFPEIAGYTGMMPLGIVWDAIGRTYLTRYVNETLKIWWQDQANRLTRPWTPMTDYLGALLASESLLNMDIAWARAAPAEFVMEAARYARFSLHAGRSLTFQWRRLRPRARVLWAAALPIGVALYVAERSGLRLFARRLRSRGRLSNAPTSLPTDG